MSPKTNMSQSKNDRRPIKKQGTGKQTSAFRSPGSRGISTSGPGVPPPSAHVPSARHTQTSNRTKQGKVKRSKAELLITGGILVTATALSVSLLAYFRPFSLEDIRSAAAGIYTYAARRIAGPKESAPDEGSSYAQEITDEMLTSESETEKETDGEPEEISHMARTDEMGDISDMTAETVYPPQDTIYSCMLDSSMGPLFYYNQGDIRWKEYLYGGQDRISKYGCGPTCVAMVINSFSTQPVSPIEMADWSAANGHYAPQSGSYHSLIPESIAAFGLQVESVTERTPEHVTELLSSGYILVALMGKGSLTNNGHFIIIAQLCGNGNVYIADPASYENSTKEWDLQLLMDELKHSYDSGGPLWAVSL